MAFLILENLAKRFGRDHVLSDVSLSISRGESVVIFGPSGCGKTVLLRLIAGVLAPDRGDIRIDGESVVHLNPEQRNLGMAFQTFALYPHLDAFENIASPLRARGVSGTDIKKRVNNVTELLRIGHVLDHRPAQLSNGQKQRTALARALVSGPKLLLLDDPLRNVDAKLRYEMRLELPRVLREFESTVLYVTQDYKEAMALGHRIGVLYDGQFQQVDTPLGTYRHPLHTRVARLFGDPTINLVPAKVGKNPSGQLSLSLGSEQLALPEQFRPLEGIECLFGIRPEDIRVSTELPTQAAGALYPEALALELETVTPMNLRNVLLLRSRDGTELLASTEESRSFGRTHTQVWATINWQHAVFFDNASGSAIMAH